ncbi:MAG TPA: hypothetical protein VMR45_05525 [Patescibacteria group bacterium]|nr:hypothetical protein [Patescibacteria group bacterium]
MNTAEQILVMILAIALAVLLTVAIVATVLMIRLIKTAQKIADKTENLVESAESVGDMIKQTVGNLSFLRLVHVITDFIHNKTSKRGGL